MLCPWCSTALMLCAGVACDSTHRSLLVLTTPARRTLQSLCRMETTCRSISAASMTSSCLGSVRLTSTCSLATHFLIKIWKVLVWNRVACRFLPTAGRSVPTARLDDLQQDGRARASDFTVVVPARNSCRFLRSWAEWIWLCVPGANGSPKSDRICCGDRRCSQSARDDWLRALGLDRRL